MGKVREEGGMVRTRYVLQDFDVADVRRCGSHSRDVDEGVIDAGGVGLRDILVPNEEGMLSSIMTQVRESPEVEGGCP